MSGLEDSKSSSQSTVQVSIISPNRVLGVPASLFLDPEIPGTTYNDTPCLCFLIEHEEKDGNVKRLLFDLGIRKDVEAGAPSVSNAVKDMNIEIQTPKDMKEILEERNLKPSDIDSIVLSHHHFDHIGDVGAFPPSTFLIVGPGFKDKLMPGHPNDPDSAFLQKDFEGRDVREIDFSKEFNSIHGLRAIDFFHDGSFFLLDAPGHAIGHMCGLARTTSSEESYILLAGDACHHAGALRPTDLLPLKADVVRRTIDNESQRNALLEVVGQKEQGLLEPFYVPADRGFNMSAAGMIETLKSIRKFDADPNVLVLLAHDHWLLHEVDLWPGNANQWKKKAWKDKVRWTFLKDLYAVV